MTSLEKRPSPMQRQASIIDENATANDLVIHQMYKYLNSGDFKESVDMKSFYQLFKRYILSKDIKSEVSWDEIKSPTHKEVVDYNELTDKDLDASKILSKLAVLKLNGGLGTSMGCVGPKSVIEVRDGNSFLDLSVKQIDFLNTKYKSNVPLLLMNSFNTNNDTQQIIKKYSNSNCKIRSFNQSKFPRVYKDSLLPVASDMDAELDSWYPPGHGDLFESLYNSGELDELINNGTEVLFVSN